MHSCCSTENCQGPSINDVGNWRGEGSKISQNCRRIVLKNSRYGGGGCLKFRKIADVVYGWSLNWSQIIMKKNAVFPKYPCLHLLFIGIEIYRVSHRFKSLTDKRFLWFLINEKNQLHMYILLSRNKFMERLFIWGDKVQ